MAEVRDDRGQVSWPGMAAGRRGTGRMIILLVGVVAAIAIFFNLSRRPGHRMAAPVAAESESVAPSATPPVAQAEPPGDPVPAAAAPAAAAADPEAAIEEPGAARDEKQIARVIEDGRPGLAACYQRALARDATLVEGKLRVRVSVAPSGRVDAVHVAGPATFRVLEPCLRQSISHWTFPPASAPYRAQFPLAFSGKQ